MIELLKNPWPWYVSGPLISLTMLILLVLGGRFGLSSSMRTMCTMMGADKVADFFKFDWKAQSWNLFFVLGGITGGFIAAHFLKADTPFDINENTVAALQELGIQTTSDYLPTGLFSWENLATPRGFLFMIIGGFLVGFGTRWAGGCTSGHAISGLSNLQLPSLIAVIGFFIGGLLMTWVILPQILALN